MYALKARANKSLNTLWTEVGDFFFFFFLMIRTEVGVGHT